MAFSGPAQLSHEDWAFIEEINDLLSGSPNLPVDLQLALERTLEWLGRSGGVLTAPNHFDDSGIRLQHNLPDLLQRQIDDPYSPIQQLTRQVMESGDALPDTRLPDLAGAFPIRARSQIVGTLLVIGEVIQPQDYPRWEMFIKPFGRAIFARPQNRIAGMHAGITALQGISVAQSGEHDTNNLQHCVLQGMRDIFEAEDALLILLDDDNPRMAIKKQLKMGDDWVERTSLDIENSLVFRSIREARCIEESLCSTNNFIPWLSSTTGTKIQTVICTPLIAKQSAIGAIVLINPELDAADLFRKSLLNQLASTLAYAIYTNRQMLNLKISIADLEASRWEIVNSRNTLRTLFDSIPASVYIIDRAYTLISINIRRSNRASRRPSALVGKKCFELLYGRNDPCPACRITETFTNGGTTNRFSREWFEEDQERFIEWEITTFPIQEKSNLPHQVILFEEDVTEKRNLEANLIQSEKLAAVGQLAAGVAHEINNPLAAIIANAQILLRELAKGDPDTLDAIKLIETAGVRASKVVSNLLGIARKEKRYEFELLSLNETIQGALSLVHHEIVNHSIEVNLDLQEDMPETVMSKNQIQGVWINMIVNSIDAIDQPGGQITISTRFTEREFRVIFSDNGKGIPEDQLSRIFEPFYTTKVAGKGTGLGLSVCHRVIKEHQGSIHVESLPGKGTRFIIVLPDLSRTSREISYSGYP